MGPKSWIGAVVFFAFAALQYNDPDPIRWASIYGAAGLACLLARRLRPAWPLPAAVGLAALAWAAAYLPVVGRMAFSHLFETMKAETPAIEEGRELLGLLIVAAWMAVLTAGALRRSDAPPRGGPAGDSTRQEPALRAQSEDTPRPGGPAHRTPGKEGESRLYRVLSVLPDVGTIFDNASGRRRNETTH